MPKKIKSSLVEKREWLEAYEGGKSEASIARDSHRDVRTVKKGIESARLEHDLRSARADMVKRALGKHQDALTGELDEVVSSVRVPPRDWVPLSWHQGERSVFTPDVATQELAQYRAPPPKRSTQEH